MSLLGFRPALWPTLISIPCFLAALALGTWQVERLQWKEALIAERTAQLAAPPVTLPAQLPAGDPEFDFRHAQATGRLLHDHELYMLAPSNTGDAGYHVITPLQRDDGSVVLVDRGWVPGELRLPANRAAGQLAGPVTIVGISRTRFHKGYFQPENEPAKNLWFWLDLPAMAQAAGVPAQPVLLEAGPAPVPGVWPKGGQTYTGLFNNHLSYIVTWYSVAITIAVIYVLWHRRREKAEVQA